MAEKSMIGVVFVLFITLIVGVVLVSTIMDSVELNTNTLQTLNRSVDISSVRIADNNVNPGVTFTLAGGAGQVLTSVDAVRFDNGTILVEDTDWFTNSTDNLGFLNSTLMVAHPNNDTDVDYTLEPQEYVSSPIARTLLNLIGLFFVIGLLLFAVGKLKDFGLFGME